MRTVPSQLLEAWRNEESIQILSKHCQGLTRNSDLGSRLTLRMGAEWPSMFISLPLLTPAMSLTLRVMSLSQENEITEGIIKFELRINSPGTRGYFGAVFVECHVSYSGGEPGYHTISQVFRVRVNL